MTPLTRSSSRSSAPARFATERSPLLPSYGDAVARVAEALGTPLLPWQRQVNDVISEVNEDGTGWKYPVAVVTVPRQAGKTTWLGALFQHRAMQFPRSRHWYTAQTGMAGRDAFLEWQERWSATFGDRAYIRFSQGAETMEWRPNGSMLRVFAPIPRSLHGRQGDTIALDECWWFTPDAGEALLQAAVPTQATRPWRQLLLVSTAGADDSVWWRGWIEKGRKAVGDPSAKLAYFEWAAEDGADLTDPAVWPTYHPAHGSLISDDAMHAALEQLGTEGFARAFGNRWPPAEISWRAGWPLCLSLDDLMDENATVTFAVDATPDHRSASIVASGLTRLGRVAVEVIDHRPGVDWIVPRLADLGKRHRAEVVIQRTGPLGYLIPEAKKAGVRVIPATSEQYGDAVARFKTLVTEGRLAHVGDTRLGAAVDAAVTMRRGDRDIWARRDVTADICPLVAATFAVWVASIPKSKPVVATA